MHIIFLLGMRLPLKKKEQQQQKKNTASENSKTTVDLLSPLMLSPFVFKSTVVLDLQFTVQKLLQSFQLCKFNLIMVVMVPAKKAVQEAV